MKSEILQAIKQICDEKKISLDLVIGTIEMALSAAYRKDFGKKNQNIKVEFDSETAQAKVYDVKTVVESPEEVEEETEKEGEAEEKHKFNPKLEITLEEAQKIKAEVKIGDIIKTRLEVPATYGRMAAQTAKQVIIQKLREAERETLYMIYEKKRGEVVTGTVQRREGRMVLVDLGDLTAFLPPVEQIEGERYEPGARFKVIITEVNRVPKGPEVIVSRSHPEIVRKLFKIEVPEVESGSVEIKIVAREAGSRSKIAALARQKNIDPIGACVGQRGTRVQTVINELGGEKIDIIEYDEDPAKFVTQALGPAKISKVEINEKKKEALVFAKEDQLSLAIGKKGQNVRLAAKLTGWKINIKEMPEKQGKTKKEKTKEEEKSKK